MQIKTPQSTLSKQINLKYTNKNTSSNLYLYNTQIKIPQVTCIYTICTNKNTSSNFYLYNYLKTFIYTTSRSIKNKFYLHMICLKKMYKDN